MRVQSVLQNLQALGTRRLAILGVVGALIVCGIVVTSLFMARTSMIVLYNNLDRGDAARIGQALEEMHVPFDIQSDGTAVLVAPRDVRQARMGLAMHGLPSSRESGYELFDDAGALGLTSFMQQITRTRALEGELARTIQTMEGVLAARVHLVLPEREAFSKNAALPTASVVLRTTAAAVTMSEKAAAIQRLVASSVPKLRLEDVTVLDSTGVVLAAQGTNSPKALRDLDLKHDVESQLSETVSKILTPYLGEGSFRLAVTATLNTDREFIAEETYDPDSRVERSHHNVAEDEEANDLSHDPPTTVSQNLPDQKASAATGSSSKSKTARSEETVNFEISSVKRELTREGGRVERVNVAVLIDGLRIKGQNGEEVYTPRSREELQKIASIVRTAAGFDEKRGDVVTVESVEFQNHDVDPAHWQGPGWLEIVMQNIGTVVQSVVLLLIVSMLVFFGLRPLMTRLVDLRADRRQPVAAEGTLGVGEAQHTFGATASMAALPESGIEVPRQLPSGAETERFLDDMIQLKTMEGKVRESSLAKLGEVVDKNPDEALAILRSWIYEGTSV